jgi:TolB-like protein
LETLIGFFEWIGRNEAVLSGIAASIVIIGVLFSPLGAGLRALTDGRRDRPAPEPEPVTAKATTRVGARPSIAVLPFSTPSGEPAHEALADGLAEDLVNALGRVKHFDVLARSATAAYRGRNVDVRDLARELGARYAVEGSVRGLGGDRVRITVQLVAADTAAPVWSDRHESSLQRGPEAQDDITSRLAAALQPAVRRAEADRARRSRADELDAWSLVNRAWVTIQGGLGSPEAARAAVADCTRAIELDPDDALAHAVLAHSRSLLIASPGESASTRESVMGSVRRAVELGGHDPAVQHCYAAVLGNVGRTADGIRAWERCLDLDPSNAPARAGLGIAQIYVRKPEDALANIERALWLSPRDPLVYHWLAHRALACSILGRYVDAATSARESVERAGTRVGWGVLAVAEALLGHDAAAHEAWSELALRTPGLDVDGFARLVRDVCPDEETASRFQAAARRAAQT